MLDVISGLDYVTTLPAGAVGYAFTDSGYLVEVTEEGVVRVWVGSFLSGAFVDIIALGTVPILIGAITTGGVYVVAEDEAREHTYVHRVDERDIKLIAER